MADKITQQITDALTRAAAHPAGLPLYAARSEPGLFANSSAARSAAQKCLTDGLVRAIVADGREKAPRELFALTDPGWEFLLAQVNPKQVLEDFVRVLEARQGEVGELLDTARRMAASLQGLQDAVARVLPSVSAARVQLPDPPAPSPRGRGGEDGPFPLRAEGGEGSRHSRLDGDTALLDAPPGTELAPVIAPVILTRLAGWSGSAGEDCPLPELYRSLAYLEASPTIGEFHDCLRQLHADGALYLHPWTGPLYALPEPAYALLAGHNVAYYASLK